PAGTAMLKRILYWTGGHPYLTQRLCQAVAEDGNIRYDNDVDRLCEELFLAPRAQERDDNLLFVRECLLRGGDDLSGVLEVYRRLWKGRAVSAGGNDPRTSLLRLSGIARVKVGGLQVRNRIYARVFNQIWI